MALDAVRSAPASGKMVAVEMTDPRWLAAGGWAKMQQTTITTQQTISIHSVYNLMTGAVADTKFINPVFKKLS